MTNKTLFLHVGAGKTGSTAIQQFLKKNRETLADFGYEVPRTGIIDEGMTFAHHPLTEWVEGYRQVDSEPLWNEIASTARGHVVISSEAFHNRIAAKGGEEFFEKIRKIFRGFEVRIIFYIRRQDQWLESVYEQWIKSGNLRSGVSIAEFVQSYKRDLPAQIFAFEKVFGTDSILVRPYEKSQLVNGDAAKDFLSLLGIPENERLIYSERNPNPRLTREALVFARWYNWSCSNERESVAVRQQLLEFSRLVSSERTGTRYSVHDSLPSKLRREIFDRHTGDYQEIAKRFLGRPEGRLFYDEPKFADDVASRTNCPLDVEAFVRMEAFLYKNLHDRLDKLEENLSKANDN